MTVSHHHWRTISQIGIIFGGFYRSDFRISHFPFTRGRGETDECSSLRFRAPHHKKSRNISTANRDSRYSSFYLLSCIKSGSRVNRTKGARKNSFEGGLLSRKKRRATVGSVRLNLRVKGADNGLEKHKAKFLLE